MTKKYIIMKMETKVSEIPKGFYMTTRTEYFGVTTGFLIPCDTLEEAEKELAEQINWDSYTIVPIYTA